MNPLFREGFECVSVEKIHQLCEFRFGCGHRIDRIEDKSININPIDLILGVIQRIEQFLRNIDTRHRKKEPLLLHDAFLVHFERHVFAFGVCAEFEQLFEAEKPGATEISRWVLPLEPDVYPLLGHSIVKWLVRFERGPKAHEHFFMLLIFFTVGFYGAPCFLDFVVEPNPVNQPMAPVKVHRCVLNLANFEKLIDTNVCRRAIVFQQVHLHIVILF